MSTNQTIIPYLCYADSNSALEFLCNAFGFEERMRVPYPDGGVMHAEASLNGNIVMLGTPRDASGKAMDLKDAPGSRSSTMCYLDDVDAHYARAKAKGAKITAELEDKPYGDRMYGATDPQGHQWYFAKRGGASNPQG